MANAVRKPPRQPIPPLAETLDAARRSVSPMLNGLQRLKSRLVFELYGASQAAPQKRLLSLARQRPINWCAAGLTHLWLSNREGLPFANNYVLMLEDDPRATTLTERAARLILAGLQLYRAVSTRTLAPDVAARLPLEMDQYRRCFATHRRPCPQRDELITVTGSQHIALLMDGQVHILAVDLQQGVSLCAVQQTLDLLVENGDADSEVDQAPGMLTALPREQWARQREELLKESANRQTLTLLEKALFVVCLDTGVLPGSAGGYSANLRDGNAHNRCYDKSLQIVVMENGKAGLCFERAAVDGSVALGFAARLQAASLLLPKVGEEATAPTPALRRRAMSWSVSPALKRQLLAAKRSIADRRAGRGIETWAHTTLGSRRLKALGISPDAAVQLAIQRALFEVTGETPAIFEPVQLRHFAGGRMDFIVPVTAESLEAIHALGDPGTNQYHLARQICRAAREHRELVLRTRNGRGLIAHLLALNAIQAQDAVRHGTRPWHRAVLARLDKGLQALFRQDVLAANGSGWPGVAAFGPIGPRPDMVSIGYLIGPEGISFDLRADGRFGDQARALRLALEKALAGIDRALATLMPARAVG
jgi:carnitine O-acetyltransferase